MTDKQNSRKEDYIKAKEKTEELKGFFISLISYFIVIPFLVYIWYEFSRYTIQWFWFPVFFWGLSLIVQGLKIYGYNVPFGKAWEEKKIKKYMNQEDS